MAQNYLDMPPGQSISTSLDLIEGRDDALRSAFSGTSSPPTPVTGQFWLNTSVSPNTLNIWNDSSWINLGPITANLNHLRLDGTNSPSANIPLATFKFTGAGDPAAAQEFVTRNYFDANGAKAGLQTAKLALDTAAGAGTGLVNNGGGLTVAWTEAIDQGGFITIESNSEVKITVAGTYLIDCSVYHNGTGVSRWEIRKAARTGTKQKRIDVAGSVGALSPGNLTDIITFAANDNFDIHDVHGTSSFLNDGDYTRLLITRLY